MTDTINVGEGLGMAALSPDRSLMCLSEANLYFFLLVNIQQQKHTDAHAKHARKPKWCECSSRHV